MTLRLNGLQIKKMSKQLIVSNPINIAQGLCEFCGIDLDDGNYHTPGCANEDDCGSPVGTRSEYEHRTGDYNGQVAELADAADSKSASLVECGFKSHLGYRMNTNNVWQKAFEKFDELDRLTHGENDETTEYYDLLKQLHAYDYCMTDEFKAAFYEEVDNHLEYEKEWRASMEDE